MKVAPQLYIRGSAEAAAFYQRAFGLTIGMTDMNGDGTYKHISLMSGETEILAIGENPDNISYYSGSGKEPIGINIWDLGTNEAVDQAFAVLREDACKTFEDAPGSPEWDAEGGHYAFGVIDKYGVNWGVHR